MARKRKKGLTRRWADIKDNIRVDPDNIKDVEQQIEAMSNVVNIAKEYNEKYQEVLIAIEGSVDRDTLLGYDVKILNILRASEDLERKFDTEEYDWANDDLNSIARNVRRGCQKCLEIIHCTMIEKFMSDNNISLDLVFNETNMIGSIVNMADHEWMVAKIDDEKCYLISRFTIGDTCRFGEENSTYATSDLAKMCEEFLSKLPADVVELLIPVTVSGVTAKIFVPSRKQLEHMWGYFKSEKHRVIDVWDLPDDMCPVAEYWTSSLDDEGLMLFPVTDKKHATFVDEDGDFDLEERDCENVAAFRPACCVKTEYLKTLIGKKGE